MVLSDWESAESSGTRTVPHCMAVVVLNSLALQGPHSTLAEGTACAKAAKDRREACVP